MLLKLISFRRWNSITMRFSRDNDICCCYNPQNVVYFIRSSSNNNNKVIVASSITCSPANKTKNYLGWQKNPNVLLFIWESISINDYLASLRRMLSALQRARFLRKLSALPWACLLLNLLVRFARSSSSFLFWADLNSGDWIWKTIRVHRSYVLRSFQCFEIINLIFFIHYRSTKQDLRK